jgi:hypothetical protein
MVGMKNTKNKHGKVKMKRLRNVEKLLFTFLHSALCLPPLFKEQGEELIVVLRLSTELSLLG